MARKLISLLSKFRSVEDAVLEARFSKLGAEPTARRNRVSPFRATRFA